MEKQTVYRYDRKSILIQAFFVIFLSSPLIYGSFRESDPIAAAIMFGIPAVIGCAALRYVMSLWSSYIELTDDDLVIVRGGKIKIVRWEDIRTIEIFPYNRSGRVYCLELKQFKTIILDSGYSPYQELVNEIEERLRTRSAGKHF